VSVSQFCEKGDKGEVTDDDSIVLKAPGSKYFVDQLMSQLNESVITLNTTVIGIDYGNATENNTSDIFGIIINLLQLVFMFI
jgi:hypothetical protein